jgi:hypothetical protein
MLSRRGVFSERSLDHSASVQRSRSLRCHSPVVNAALDEVVGVSHIALEIRRVGSQGLRARRFLGLRPWEELVSLG